MTAGGGKVVGSVRAPLATSDFSSFLLQAQSSGAQVLGLANAGGDFINSLKAAHEFGVANTMKPAALLAFITDINALGLDTAQGLYLTTAWYWDLNDKTRAFGKRFLDKTGAEPTMNQAAYYSATLTYLAAVKAAGTTDPDKVMEELHKAKVDDMFADDGIIRADGLMQHSMYVMQVKKPSESKGPWDYYKIVKKMSGEQAFGKLADRPARWRRNSSRTADNRFCEQLEPAMSGHDIFALPENLRVLVTAGASGIGRAISDMLIARGAKLQYLRRVRRVHRGLQGGPTAKQA